MKIHELKILPEFYNDIIEGSKTFEVRFDDRAFAVGDILHLRSCENGCYDGDERECLVRVTYICHLNASLGSSISSTCPVVVGMVIKRVGIIDVNGSRER